MGENDGETAAAAVCASLLLPFVGICVLLYSRAQLLLIAIVSGFAWFMAVTVIALLFVLIDAKTIGIWALLSVLAQECARLIMVVLYRKMTEAVADSYDAFDDLSTSLAAGIGFAAAHAVAISGATECPIAGAMLALCFQLMDLVLARLALFALPVRGDTKSVVFSSLFLQTVIIGSHLLATAATLAIPCRSSQCVASVPLPFLALGLAVAVLALSLKVHQDRRPVHHFRALHSSAPPPTAADDDEFGIPISNVSSSFVAR